jgi:methyl-accepting chemotaxis protein
LQQNESDDCRKTGRLPCHLELEVKNARGAATMPIYEIAMDGVLIGGADAARLSVHETIDGVLDGIGACRLRITEQTKTGARAQFQSASAELREKVEDKLWSIHEENTEFVTRAMEAGNALTRILEQAVARGAVTIDSARSGKTAGRCLSCCPAEAAFVIRTAHEMECVERWRSSYKLV